MFEFNPDILASWILGGYEGFRIYNYTGCHVIEPFIENHFDDGCLVDYDLISIKDPLASTLANNAAPNKIPCYVENLYLEDHEN